MTGRGWSQTFKGFRHLISEAERRSTYHIYDLRVHTLSDNTSLSGDVFEHFMESLGLNLLALEF